MPDSGQVLALWAIIDIQQAALGDALTPDAVMERIARSACEITAAQGAVVEVIQGDQMRYAHAAGSLAGTEGLLLSAATSLSGLAVSTNETLVSNDALADPRVDGKAARRIGARSMVIVPLNVDGATLAVLKIVADQVNAFSPQDVDVVTTLASFAARVLQQTQVMHARRLEHETYRLVSQTSTDAILQVGLDGCIRWASPAAEEILGYSPDSLIGMIAIDLIHPERREEYAQRIGEAVALGGDTRWEYPALRPDGATVWVESAGRFARDEKGELLYRVVRIRDVSTAHEAAAALARSEAQFRSAMQNAPIGMCLIAVDGSFMEVNEALCRLLGRPAQALMRSSWQDLTHPDDLDVDLDFAEQAVAGELDQYRLVKRYLRPDGAVVWGDLSVSAVRDERGEVLHFVSQIVDLTELMSDQQRAQAAINRYQRMVSVGTDVIAELDADTNVLWVSPNTDGIFGVSAASLVGRQLLDFVPGDQRARVRVALAEAGHFEFSIGRQGHMLRVEAVTQRQADPGAGLIVRIRDITDHFETREQLRHQARTDALTGLMAGPELERRLEALLGHEPRAGTRAVLARIGVDGLDSVRDMHGQSVADELLRTVASRVRATLRESDLVARAEADDLLALLPGIALLSDAVAVLQRLVQEASAPHHAAEVVLRPRLSVGATEVVPDEWLEVVLERVEQALTVARDRGGNRVHLDLGADESVGQVISFPERGER